MLNKLFIYLQYLLPQHLLSSLMGVLAESCVSWFKNLFIGSFIKIYKVDLSEATITDPRSYPTFNSFFIRQLRPDVRIISSRPQDLVSPVDGCISQIGYANRNLLFQAKNFYFNLEALLANKEIAQLFDNGSFATLYLAPPNYHRVHMPISGRLQKTIYVPGSLFSVNRLTAESIPNLFSRNERLICLFATEIGSIAIILVGAMIVGSIQTVWMQEPIKGRKIIVQDFQNGLFLEKGAELGYFKMGSTVIILCQKQKLEWLSSLKPGSSVKFGQNLGVCNDYQT